jgi:hypothetical protein
MKRIVLALLVLLVAGSAWAQTPNVPDGLTGLWQFATEATKFKATIGTDLASTTQDGTPFDRGWFAGKYTQIGTVGNPNLFSDHGDVQTPRDVLLTVTHNIAPNGGGIYVNQYTFAVDYQQTGLEALWDGNYYNSIFQTSMTNSNDGDLFIKGPDYPNSVIGTGQLGYSILTFDPSEWHRIVWSADCAAGVFDVYIDGVNYLHSTNVSLDDSRYALDPKVNLFSDNDWETAWGYVATAASWNRALTSAEVAAMGNTDTPLIVPEPSVFVLLAAGLVMVFVIRKKK